MRKFLLLAGASALAGLVSFFFIHFKQHDPDSVETLLPLSPTPTEIQREITIMSGASQNQRRNRFAERFTQRFREHDLQIPVLIRYIDTTGKIPLIRLCCPARTEPWNMDRLALAVYRESRICLNEPCNIDVYETYIAAPSRKIGTLRSDLNNTNGVHLLYDPEPLKRGKRVPHMVMPPVRPGAVPDSIRGRVPQFFMP